MFVINREKKYSKVNHLFVIPLEFEPCGYSSLPFFQQANYDTMLSRMIRRQVACMAEFRWVDAPVPAGMKITQVYAVTLDRDGRVMLRVERQDTVFAGRRTSGAF